MWSAPTVAFNALSISGMVLMAAGIGLEAIGIALEHRDRRQL
jgi:hypothetical protein